METIKMEEHDFEHIEYVKCLKCGKIVDCHDYYNKKKHENYGECREVNRMETNTELNKIKIVLLALWDKSPHPEAQDIIKKYREEMSKVEK